MSALSTHGISPETPEAPLWVKIVWGATIGLVAMILVAAAGLDGIRRMSVLGGFPALFVIGRAALSLLLMALRGRHRAVPASAEYLTLPDAGPGLGLQIIFGVGRDVERLVPGVTVK